MAYDAARQEVVLFGGFDLRGPVAETWTWDGQGWVRRQPPTSPPARGRAVLAYDSARQEVLLFGGTTCDESGICRVLNDLWAWDGSTWTARTPHTSSPHPAPRSFASMAFHAESRHMVLFGGRNEFSSYTFADTWVWDGDSWEQRTPVRSPDARFAAAASAGPTREAVLFGGIGCQSSVLPVTLVDTPLDECFQYQTLGDTWVWDGTNWARKKTPITPSPRANSGMTYDEAVGLVVLFGGDVENDTWTWNGTVWSLKETASAPSPRGRMGFAHHAPTGTNLLFGGFRYPPFDETWTLDMRSNPQPSWTMRPRTRPPVNWLAATSAYHAATRSVVLFGNCDSQSLCGTTSTWDGARWTERSRGQGPTLPARRIWAAMAPHHGSGRAVLFGGCYGAFCDQGLITDDTWTWDGTNWRQEDPAVRPPPRFGHAMAYDAARDRLVLFGGSDGRARLNDTWTWDGNNWRQEQPAIPPPTRTYAAVAYDAARKQVVLFGGTGDGDRTGTWTWNGTNWTEQGSATTPPAAYGHAMAYDAVDKRVMLFDESATWAWDGATWSEEQVVTRPPTQDWAPMAAHDRCGHLLLSGGFQHDDAWVWSARRARGRGCM